MKKSLIMKYVAEKLTKFDSAMKRAKEELGAECFLEVVKGTVVTELDPKFKAAIETVLKRRFNLRFHKCVFFNTPTVEQWIADLTGLLSEEALLTTASNKKGLPFSGVNPSSAKETHASRFQPFSVFTCRNIVCRLPNVC